LKDTQRTKRDIGSENNDIIEFRYRRRRGNERIKAIISEKKELKEWRVEERGRA
jgi:hypothetical protein